MKSDGLVMTNEVPPPADHDAEMLTGPWASQFCEKKPTSQPGGWGLRIEGQQNAPARHEPPCETKPMLMFAVCPQGHTTAEMQENALRRHYKRGNKATRHESEHR